MQVGDSPLVGSGGYADDLAGAVRSTGCSHCTVSHCIQQVSSTGHGESIARVCLAHRTVQSLASGTRPDQAAAEGEINIYLPHIGWL